MANHRVGESGPSNHHSHLPYAVLQGISNPSTASFLHQERSSFDFGELEEAIVLQGVKFPTDEAKPPFSSGRSAATLEMFPSWPIRFHETQRGSSNSGEESTESGSAVNFLHSKAEEAQLEQSESPMSSKKPPTSDHNRLQPDDQLVAKPTHEKRKGAGSTSEKQLDAKTLRRLAQNREAARKSRLRKKAYVQQLESSRLKLTQIEQDLQRSRSQGLFLGACGAVGGNISSGAAVFDMEYARWLDDDHRHMGELRGGLHAHLPDSDLRIVVDGYISHYDELFRLKEVAAKSDVFHLITGLWMSPAERCFLWMGGFRPSELIKMLISQLDPITEQQVMGICKLQHSSQQAEEALSQGLEQLHQSLIDTIAGGPIIDGMNGMIVAIGKLANLEGFVCQVFFKRVEFCTANFLSFNVAIGSWSEIDIYADILRQQTLHQLRRILTIRQAARCFLVIGEYYGRLRALSSLWSSRPRETMINDDNSCQTSTELHMIQQPPPNHFSNF